MGIFPAYYVPGKFNHRHLHPKAYPEKRNLVLARIPYGCYLSLYSAVAKTGGYQKAVQVAKLVLNALFRKQFRVYEFKVYFAVIFCSGMYKSFRNGFIGIR